MLQNNLHPAPDTKSTTKNHRNALVSRNITINNHRTSVRLEPEMWAGLQEICRREKATIHKIGSEVAKVKPDNASLTAALRVFVMAYYRAAATQDGHDRAGHGQGVGQVVRAAPPLQTMTPSYAAMKMAQQNGPSTAPRPTNPSSAGGFVNRGRF